MCQQFNPIVYGLEEEYKGRIKFLWLNVDKQEVGKLAVHYRVMAVPTTILADPKGKPLETWVGPRDKDFLKEAFDRALEEK